MPALFHCLTWREFASALDHFPFTRRIDAVHMHHTWRPNHSQYQGHDSIVAMWRLHTQHNGWSDMAPHMTIAPDGTIWTGRNWNQPPASAAGHNGNRTAGPFMCALIGDFDHGHDRFAGDQRRVALAVIALVQKKFNLPPETLRFHNQMSTGSCPGSSLNYQEMVEAVRALPASGDGAAIFGTREASPGPFGWDMFACRQAIEAFSRTPPLQDDPDDAEPDDDSMSAAHVRVLCEDVPVVQPAVALPTTPPAPPVPHGVAAGRWRALCVGINQYPTAPLYGCVADAETWQATLQQLGFTEMTVLYDHQATRHAILTALVELVTTSRAGDVVVFQFAGHGTQLPDVSGDEADGDTPGQDEALCPIDFAHGAFVIDDDIGAIFAQIPSGVNVTCFIDCCHSGTISRFGVGVPSAAGASSQGLRARFIPATPQMAAAHRQFRQRQGRQRAVASSGMSVMKEVLFAACLSSEVAYENAGHGDFTVRATGVLQAGLGRLTNAQFETQVITAFGPGARQHARLYCHPDAKGRGLLQPLRAGQA